MDEVNSSKRISRWKTLLVIDIVFFMFLLVYFSRVQMQEGDSFEYAGIARNLLTSGEMREDLLRNYCIMDQQVPHPASLRANLYVYLLVPFYAVFRESQWTFVLPAIIGLFFLPLAVFKVGRRFFSEEAAFYAALLSLFAPSVLRLYTFMDPGLPEAWQMVLYLLFILVIVEEKYVAAGVIMAVAFLFKRNSVVLIPAVLIWLGLNRRKQLFGMPVVKIFGAALLLVLPFFVRSYLVFGSPFHNEQFAGLSRPYAGQMLEEFRRGDLFGIIFNYEVYHETPMPEANTAERIKFAAQVVRTNLKMAVAGGKNAIFYIPGVLQSFGFLLLPFLVYGIVKMRGSPAAGLMALVILIQVCLHSVMAIYSDRYLMCVMPLVFLLAAHGAELTWRGLSEGLGLRNMKSAALALVLFVLITESGGYLAMALFRTSQQRTDSIPHELSVTCDALKEEDRGDSIVMTFPFLSTHFICDRKTVPLPWGSMASIARAADEYDVKYLIYSKVWLGDLFPDIPFADTVSRGRYVSLFRIDRARLDKFIADPSTSYMGGMNPVKHFLSGRFNFELSPPFYKLCVKYLRGYIPGLIIYLLLAAGFIFAFSFARGFIKRTLPLTVIILLALFAQVKYVTGVFLPMKNDKPKVSRIQAEYAVKSFPDKKKEILYIVKQAVLPGRNLDNREGYINLLIEDMKPYFKNVTVSEGEADPVSEHTTMFIPVPEIDFLLVDEYAYSENVEFYKQRSALQTELVEKYEARGFAAVPIYGGVFVY